MMSLKEYRTPSKRLPDLLPWAAIIAPGVVLQKDAILQKTISYRGPDMGSASLAEMAADISRVNNAIKRLGSGWSIFTEAQRFECDSYQNYAASQFDCRAAWLLEMERQEQYSRSGAQFQSTYYMTFCWQLPSTQNKQLKSLFFERHENPDISNENMRDLEHFIRTVSEVVDIMSAVFVDCYPLDDDQTLTYLHSTISTNRHPIVSPDVPIYLDALLPDQAFSSGNIPMLGKHFIPTATINGFPSSALPAILDDLNHLNVEYRWVTRFIACDKDYAEAELKKYRKRWWAKRKGIMTMLKEEATKEESALVDNDASNKAADADAALQELGDDLVSFGFVTSTITVWDTDQRDALAKMQLVKRAIQARGFSLKDETLNGQDAWLGSLPGHVYANVRRPIINTLNLAHIMPLSSIWAGESVNKHLEAISGVGSPHVLCATTGATSFHLNLNVGDVGHTKITGPTSSGKSTLLNLLALMWLRYPKARVVIFDKDRSSRATTMAVQGKFYEPGRSDKPTAFQPLRALDTDHDLVWAAQFVLTMLSCQGIDHTPGIKKEIDESIKKLASVKPTQRTITNLVNLIQSDALRQALRRYTLRGSFGSIFDADNDGLTGGFWQAIEMGHLMEMGSEAVVPALMYIFHRIESLFDGRPTLMLLDEAWMFLDHPIFSAKMREWLKVLRKKNVFVVFATQELADAANSPLRPTIMSACDTRIYLADPDATSPTTSEYYKRFGLSDTEISLIASGTKKRDYYYRSSRGKRQFTLDLGPIALALCATTSADHQPVLDQIEREHPAAQWASEIFRYHDLGYTDDFFPIAEGAAR